MSAEIGRLIRREFGGYTKLSDEELGRIILAKIPQDITILDKILSVQSQYDPGIGRVKSWWTRGKSESRSKLLAVLMAEGAQILSLIQQRYAISDLVDAQELKKVQNEYNIESSQTLIHEQRYKQAEIMTNAMLLKLAADKHMALPDFLEWSKQVAFDNQELNFTKQAAIQNIQLAEFAKHMSDHQQLDILIARLGVLYDGVHQIGVSDEPEEVKRRKTEDLENTISATTAYKALVEARLLEVKGSRPKGSDTASESPKDPRPPLGRDRKR